LLGGGDRIYRCTLTIEERQGKKKPPHTPKSNVGAARTAGPPQPLPPPTSSTRICVKGLPPGATEEKVRRMFSEVGVVTDVKVLKTKYVGWMECVWVWWGVGCGGGSGAGWAWKWT
jgi:hypothetical protein